MAREFRAHKDRGDEECISDKYMMTSTNVFATSPATKISLSNQGSAITLAVFYSARPSFLSVLEI